MTGPYYNLQIVKGAMTGPYYNLQIVKSTMTGPYYNLHIVKVAMMDPHYNLKIVHCCSSEYKQEGVDNDVTGSRCDAAQANAISQLNYVYVLFECFGGVFMLLL